MDAHDLPLGDGEALVVTGSQNWNPADRTIGRDNVRSLHVLTPGRARQLRSFDRYGAHGLRDLEVLDASRVLLTTGYELIEIDLGAHQSAEWPLGGGTSDIHELHHEQGHTLVANTAHDEMIILDDTGRVTERLGLDAFRDEASRPIEHTRPLGGLVPIGPKPTRDDHFHLNQAMVGHDGERLALVHHVSGFRPITHLRQRLTGHGDGGVIDLTHEAVHPLGLRAPHSLRRTSNGYAVLDSGRGEAVRYDRDWNEIARWSTGGWGRGLTIDDNRWFVGLSPTRKRYLAASESAGTNAVIAVDAASGEVAARWEVDGVEQVWAVRRVPSAIAEQLIAFDAAAPGVAM